MTPQSCRWRGSMVLNGGLRRRRRVRTVGQKRSFPVAWRTSADERRLAIWRKRWRPTVRRTSQHHFKGFCAAAKISTDILADNSFQSVWLRHLNLPITKPEQVVNMLRPALELPIGYPQSTVSLSGTSPEGTLSV